MLAQLRTFALIGIDAVPVEVEVDTAPSQMPKTVLVGLPELTVRESVHRIERALINLGYRLHMGRTVINLAPADLRKDAGAFDLPIALGMLVATGQITSDKLEGFASVGELALDGAVRPVAGALSMAMEARDSRHDATDRAGGERPRGGGRPRGRGLRRRVARRRGRHRHGSRPTSSRSRRRPTRWKGSSTSTTSTSPT